MLVAPTPAEWVSGRQACSATTAVNSRSAPYKQPVTGSLPVRSVLARLWVGVGSWGLSRRLSNFAGSSSTSAAEQQRHSGNPQHSLVKPQQLLITTSIWMWHPDNPMLCKPHLQPSRCNRRLHHQHVSPEGSSFRALTNPNGLAHAQVHNETRWKGALQPCQAMTLSCPADAALNSVSAATMHQSNPQSHQEAQALEHSQRLADGVRGAPPMRLPTPAAHPHLQDTCSIGVSGRLQHCNQRSRTMPQTEQFYQVQARVASYMRVTT